jgi:hypothetical protein
MTQKLFRPSEAPKKELCTFFEGLEIAGKRARAGTEGHRHFADVLRGTKTVEQISSVWRKRCRWALRTQHEYCPRIAGVETTLDLYDADEQWITSGTLDLWGYTEFGRPVLIDWKPGAYMDHSAQGAVYGLMLMDHLRVEECDIVTAYYDSGEVSARLVPYDRAAVRVNRLIARLRGELGPETYELNDWCSMCRLKTDGCPRWEEERQIVLKTPGMPQELFLALASIRTAPEQLGRFLVAFKRFCSLVEAHELESAAKAFLEAGVAVPGLKLQSRGYALIIDKHFGREVPELEL